MALVLTETRRGYVVMHAECEPSQFKASRGSIRIVAEIIAPIRDLLNTRCEWCGHRLGELGDPGLLCEQHKPMEVVHG